jgi:FemAB-related protein (PEP-CTERM system-associated)
MHADATVVRSRSANAPVTVRRFEPGEEARWDDYVARCRDATFFHRVGWREVIESVFRHRCHFLVAEREGAWTGVLPLAETRSRIFGHALVSLPFAVYGGPAADDAETSRALIDSAVAAAQELRVDHIELRNRAPQRPQWPRQELYVTFRKAITADDEANMLAIPRKQRAMVRKGIKHGLASEIDATAGRFFELYARNMHRHGTPPLGRRYFDRLAEVFGGACEYLIVVDASGRPASGVLSFYFRDEVFPYYAGDTEAARDLAANDFKYWELLRRAAARGVRVFDYGRSKRGTGSFDFKKNWGFEPAPLHYEYRLLKGDAIPENNPLNPRYRALIRLWRMLPLPVTTALGPLIVRGLG